MCSSIKFYITGLLNNYDGGKIQMTKFEDTHLVHVIEDLTNMKILSEIKPSLTTQPKWGDVLLTEHSSFSTSAFEGLTQFRFCFATIG